MRGTIAALPSPHPLTEMLPSMLREDPFARSLCASFDELLAPAVLTLDTFPAYLDPDLTPDDLVGWLAQWVGLRVDPQAPQPRQREELQVAGTLNAIRGTRRSIELLLQGSLGMPVDVSESGGTSWTPSSGGELPGGAEPRISVVVHPPAGTEVDRDRIDALLRSVTPAHVAYTLEIQ